MTPEQAISMLDRMLIRNGEDVTVRRVMQHKGQPSSHLDVKVRALVRSAASYDFAGGIHLDTGTVVLSPTEMTNNQWCWPVKKRDMLLIGDEATPFMIEEAQPVKLGGVIVRYDVTLEEVGRGTLQA